MALSHFKWFPYLFFTFNVKPLQGNVSQQCLSRTAQQYLKKQNEYQAKQSMLLLEAFLGERRVFNVI